jgi:hypothetical protein
LGRRLASDALESNEREYDEVADNKTFHDPPLRILAFLMAICGTENLRPVGR